jgi:hypothetical protein
MSVVEFALRLAGDVSSFTPSVQTEMKSAIAARAGVDPSAVVVTVTSGSVIVGVRIRTPTAMATSVQSAMASATSSPSSAAAMFASVPGISIAVLAVVTPPTVAYFQPSPPAQRPPGALINAGGDATTILVIAVLAAIVGLLCCLAMVCWWIWRREFELRRKDVHNWLRIMSAGTASADILQQQQPHAGGSAALAAASIPSGRGVGGGSGGIEMSGRFDRHSSETEGPFRADGAEGGTRPAMAGVIGASGSNTIRSPTMADRSRVQGTWRQQKEEVEHAAAISAREGATIVYEQPSGRSSRSEPGIGHPSSRREPGIGDPTPAFEVQGASPSEPGIGDEDLIDAAGGRYSQLQFRV